MPKHLAPAGVGDLTEEERRTPPALPEREPKLQGVM
jgi:hypothetical protein